MSEDALRGSTRVDWLRSDRAWEATSGASPLGPVNERLQMSHFEINARWQDLAIVLENRESGSIYVPRAKRADNAKPYASPVELRDQLMKLAGLEHLVILLYLYARYTVIGGAEATKAKKPSGETWPHLVDDAEFLRHQLLTVATSEMQHLRWANLLLSSLSETRLIPGWTYEPTVNPPALVIPGAGRLPDQPAQLRPLDEDAIKVFLAIEEPSGAIDGRYARATATLLRPEYPRTLYEMASTIVRDGEQHFLEFRDIQLVAAAYGTVDPAYLRNVLPGDPTNPDVKAALDTYQEIISELFAGYRGPVEDRRQLAAARERMFKLDAQAEALAAKNIGVPYLSLFPK
jgi:hypothetical protein